ncbi:MAG: 4Fe-4S dicluster domain-containing protein [Candidatus Aminicenantes bacterium]|nr:MAG: 4Fe-4S dicluster domain-containing protein [Candidatus Aminicenantes bacterium]
MADNTNIRLTINGQEVEAEKDQMLLDVACKNGIKVPTLCHHKSLGGYGACRLCVAEVTIRGRTKLTASCTYPVQDGVSVETNTEELIKIRRLVIESMLATAPNSPEIKELAEELGVESTRFKLNPDEDNKCILCGLCVRICNEKIKIGAIGFANRGAERMITPPFEDYSDVCSTCGACSVVCPTGAIDIKLFSEKPLLSIPSEFNEGLESRTPVYIPFPQAVPNIPVIDKTSCMYYLNGTCQSCSDFCEPGAIEYDQEDTVLDIDVGAIIVASGYDVWNPSPMIEYGYGVHPEVYTGMEIERLSNASGPTEGSIVMRNGEQPKRVAILHCVGSRDEHHQPYCSRICCMYSLKLAHLIREKTHAEVFEFYMDIRSFGKGYEEFYERVQHEGVVFVRGRGAQVLPVGDKLVVRAEDTDLGRPVSLPVDMVILATGVVPSKGTEELSHTLHVTRDINGFFLEAHPKLRPVDSNTDGIFLAGACQAPRDIPDTVTHASAAASQALVLLSKGYVEVVPTIAEVNELDCVGCSLCVQVCPYGAPSLVMNRGRMISEINEALCKGCGLCVAGCRGKAINLRGFNDTQLLTQLETLLQFSMF